MGSIQIVTCFIFHFLFVHLPCTIWNVDNKDLMPTNCCIYSAWMVLVGAKMGDCRPSGGRRKLWRSAQLRLEQLAHKCLSQFSSQHPSRQLLSVFL